MGIGEGGDARSIAADIFKSLGIFIASGLAEIGGGWLVWKTMKDAKPWWWALLGSAILVVYGFIPPLQNADFGRSYAAYGGLFIFMSVLWGWALDKQVPDKYDIIGGLIAITGAAIMFFAPRPSPVDPTAAAVAVPANVTASAAFQPEAAATHLDVVLQSAASNNS